MRTFYLLPALIAWMTFDSSYGTFVPPRFHKPRPEDASALVSRCPDIMGKLDSLIALRGTYTEAQTWAVSGVLEKDWIMLMVDRVAEELLAVPDWHSTRFLSLQHLVSVKQLVIEKCETRLSKVSMLLQFQIDVLRVAARMDEGGTGALEMLANAETRMAECQVANEYVSQAKRTTVGEAVIQKELPPSEDLLPQYVNDVEQMTGLLGAVGDMIEDFYVDQVEEQLDLLAEISESVSCFDYLKQLSDFTSKLPPPSVQSIWTLLALLERDLTNTSSLVENYGFDLADNTQVLEEGVNNLRTAVAVADSSSQTTGDAMSDTINELREEVLQHKEYMVRKKTTDDLLNLLDSAFAYIRKLRGEE